MDMTAVLREVDSWPFDLRLQLLEEVWNHLVDEGYEPDLTEAQRQELDRRIAEADANPGAGIPWEDVQRHLRRPR